MTRKPSAVDNSGGKSYLEIYCEQVISGEIVACKKIKKVCKKLLADLKKPYKNWHFDEEYANKPIEFIERFCKIPSGRLGQPFILELYEKAWIQAIFGFVDDKGIRRYREVFIEVARKNGKTSLIAAIELYMLIADGEGAPQIYNAATSLDQASLGYNACNRMRLQSGKIQKHVRKRADDLYCDLNMGYIMPLAANTSTLDGLDVHFGVLDEIHAMRDRGIYDLLRQGVSSRENPLLVQITTNGFVRNSIFDNQYEYATRWLEGKLTKEDMDEGDADRFLAFIYELDDRTEWTDESCWIKSNPGLGTVKKIEALRSNVAKAKSDPSYRPSVLTKDFNMPENASVAWLDFDEAVNVLTLDFKAMNFRYGICGFDASDTVDLTSAQMMMMVPDDDHIYERSMYWIPEDTIISVSDTGRRTDRDDVPYQQWIARGLMHTVEGNKVDKRVLLDWLEYLRDEEDIYCYAVGFDPWHIDDSTLRELEMFVGKERAIKVRQGPMTLSQPMKQLKADYGANRIVDNHNPVNEWCRMNVMIRTDVNSNIAPDKKNNNPKNRIDGFAAELDAYVVLNNMYDDYQQVI